MTAFADRNARAGWLGVDHGAEQLKEANMEHAHEGRGEDHFWKLRPRPVPVSCRDKMIEIQ